MEFSDPTLTTFHQELEKNTSPVLSELPFDMEHFLLKIAQYPILLCQGLGYLPLSIRKSSVHGTKEFHFNLLSIPVLLCILQTGMLLAFGYFWHAIEAMILSTIAKRYSDGITLKVCSFSFLIHTLLYRISSLRKAKHTLLFWKYNCEILDQHFREEYSNPKYSKILEGVGIHFRNCLITLSVIAIVSNFGWLVVERILVQLDLTNEGIGTVAMNQGVISIIMSVWFMFFNFSHPLSISWVNFFLRLYSVSLNVVSDKLQDLVRDKTFSEGYFSVRDLKFLFINNPGFLKTRHSLNKSFDETSFLDIIDKYTTVVELVKRFNQHLGARLTVEVAYNMGVCLGFTYFTVIWISDGFYVSALTNVLPVALAAFVLLSLGQMGTCLSERNGEILESIQKLPVHLMSEEVQWKVRMLIVKMTQNPMEITPGGFFTLNKRMITSVLSFLMTSLIVLAQFRDNGSQVVIVPPPFWNCSVSPLAETSDT